MRNSCPRIASRGWHQASCFITPPRALSVLSERIKVVPSHRMLYLESLRLGRFHGIHVRIRLCQKIQVPFLGQVTCCLDSHKSCASCTKSDAKSFEKKNTVHQFIKFLSENAKRKLSCQCRVATLSAQTFCKTTIVFGRLLPPSPLLFPPPTKTIFCSNHYTAKNVTE